MSNENLLKIRMCDEISLQVLQTNWLAFLEKKLGSQELLENQN